MSYIGNTNTTQGFIPAIDYFSGNGSTVAFTLSRPVASVAQVQANISNVPQNPSSAFSVSGNTITFTSAPPSGTNNIYVYYTSPITQVIAPSQGTVSPTSLSTGGPYWDTSGNVGIGTATPSNSAKLDVAGSIISTAATISTFNANNSGFDFIAASKIGRFFATSTDTTGGVMTFTTGQNGSYTERMRIDSSGNVGIGTSSPTAKLHVSGDALANTFKLIANTTVSGSDATIFRPADNTLAFSTNGAERARINSSGNLLLGLTSNGAAGAKFTIYAATGQEVLLTGASGTCIKFTNSQNLGGAISVASGGGTTYGTSSDYRLKHDIQPMTGALAKVAQLNPVTYKWNIDESESQGFIAHELQAVIPDAVVGEKDAVDSEGNPQYQNVDTSFLVATLTAAIQEQQAIITSLTDRITLLENK